MKSRRCWFAGADRRDNKYYVLSLAPKAENVLFVGFFVLELFCFSLFLPIFIFGVPYHCMILPRSRLRHLHYQSVAKPQNPRQYPIISPPIVVSHTQSTCPELHTELVSLPVLSKAHRATCGWLHPFSTCPPKSVTKLTQSLYPSAACPRAGIDFRTR